MANYVRIDGYLRSDTTVFKHQDFLYVRARKGLGRLHLQCALRSARAGRAGRRPYCPGTAVLLETTDTIVARQGHDHTPADYDETVNLVNRLKEAAQNDLVSRSNREVFYKRSKDIPKSRGKGMIMMKEGFISFSSAPSNRVLKKSVARWRCSHSKLTTIRK